MDTYAMPNDKYSRCISLDIWSVFPRNIMLILLLLTIL